MSNLGWYQTMVEMAKKVGGPKILMGLLAGGGALAGGTVIAGGGKIKKIIDGKLEDKKRQAESAIVHVVSKEGTSNEELTFYMGDKFKVLEIDGDAALIEKVGDKNNPYFVSAKFLSTISDYKVG